MMHLVIADSELELIPREMKKHPAVKRHGGRILDSSLHHSAMKKLKDGYRRGRPDIVHISLLVATESILNKEGMLRIYVHTRNNEVIYIDPKTRIIKNYNRFKGLMQQLLEKERVPPDGEALMEVRKENIIQLLQKLDGKKILFTPNGKKCTLHEVLEENVVCIVGGFPHGDFLSSLEEVVDEKVSIYDDALTTWSVIMEAIAAYENKFIFSSP